MASTIIKHVQKDYIFSYLVDKKRLFYVRVGKYLFTACIMHIYTHQGKNSVQYMRIKINEKWKDLSGYTECTAYFSFNDTAMCFNTSITSIKQEEIEILYPQYITSDLQRYSERVLPPELLQLTGEYHIEYDFDTMLHIENAYIAAMYDIQKNTIIDTTVNTAYLVFVKILTIIRQLSSDAYIVLANHKEHLQPIEYFVGIIGAPLILPLHKLHNGNYITDKQLREVCTSLHNGEKIVETIVQYHNENNELEIYIPIFIDNFLFACVKLRNVINNERCYKKLQEIEMLSNQMGRYLLNEHDIFHAVKVKIKDIVIINISCTGLLISIKNPYLVLCIGAHVILDFEFARQHLYIKAHVVRYEISSTFNHRVAIQYDGITADQRVILQKLLYGMADYEGNIDTTSDLLLNVDDSFSQYAYNKIGTDNNKFIEKKLKQIMNE